MNLISDLSALLSALKATPFSVKAVWKAFLKVLNDIDGFLTGSPPTFGADNKTSGVECCKAIAAECSKTEAGEVGKWGDGAFLKEIIRIAIEEILKKFFTDTPV